ncbi:hypothetical protein M127_4833 [Bacteroides fragilis str. S6L5]|nr:hypothetical protein M127_4833 [Bacteroides fragilis str. S6L5]
MFLLNQFISVFTTNLPNLKFDYSLPYLIGKGCTILLLAIIIEIKMKDNFQDFVL